ANSDTEEDLDALTIQPTDSLIICTRIKKKLNFLEVYVCEVFEDGTHNVYLHQDIMIPKPALCTAWLDCPPRGGEKGNFVAVGSLKSPMIEIWDLDVVNEVLPCVQLGRADGHTGSVIGLAWNKEFRNIVASAGADKSVKVWDVSTGKCMVTMNHHTKKVQAVAWNHYVPQVLLSGSLDRTVVLNDGRDPSHSGLKWSTKARVESLAWDPHSEHSFVVSLNDGTVKGFDIRDKSVKLWDLSNNQPSWVATHNPNAGVVLSVSFSADCPFLLAVGGLEGELNVWDTLSDAAVSRRYGS
ncbi:hypothetical protein DY000_02036501, partial [Brassica cretica]